MVPHNQSDVQEISRRWRMHGWFKVPPDIWDIPSIPVLWTDGRTVFVLSLKWLQTKAQLVAHSDWTNEFDSSWHPHHSVHMKYLSHTDRKGSSHALTVFDPLPRHKFTKNKFLSYQQPTCDGKKFTLVSHKHADWYWNCHIDRKAMK